jgi:hypothetical protein
MHEPGGSPVEIFNPVEPNRGRLVSTAKRKHAIATDIADRGNKKNGDRVFGAARLQDSYNWISAFRSAVFEKRK